MKRRIWILMAVLVMFLAGCSYSTENPEISGVSQSRETPVISVEKSEAEHAGSVAVQERDIKPVTQNASNLEESTKQPSGETVLDEETIDHRSEPESESEYDASLPGESDSQESGSSFQKVETPPEDDSQEEELPQEAGQPEEKAPEPDPEPEDSGPDENEEEPEPSEDPEPETETEPQTETVSFDIDHWISLAKGLAEEKGLHLDPSATDCWDNPITANASCIYIERDLNSRLSRYAGDEEITDVWIWYEYLGNQQYLIYIGYA